jgi:hypothetical protein
VIDELADDGRIGSTLVGRITFRPVGRELHEIMVELTAASDGHQLAQFLARIALA